MLIRPLLNKRTLLYLLIATIFPMSACRRGRRLSTRKEAWRRQFITPSWVLQNVNYTNETQFSIKLLDGDPYIVTSYGMLDNILLDTRQGILIDLRHTWQTTKNKCMILSKLGYLHADLAINRGFNRNHHLSNLLSLQVGGGRQGSLEFLPVFYCRTPAGTSGRQ